LQHGALRQEYVARRAVRVIIARKTGGHMRIVINEAKRLQQAWRNSLAGFAEIWRSEAAFRWWFLCNVVTTIAALVLPLGTAERALVIGFSLNVLLAELGNTAIEKTIDRIGPERHELSRIAKDLGSAWVMAAALVAGVVWVIVLIGLL
jgi:diacylglycerol kinase (ATP)